MVTVWGASWRLSVKAVRQGFARQYGKQENVSVDGLVLTPVNTSLCILTVVDSTGCSVGSFLAIFLKGYPSSLFGKAFRKGFARPYGKQAHLPVDDLVLAPVKTSLSVDLIHWI